MIRRRFAVVRRPRLLGPAVVGGIGFALGRVRRQPRFVVLPAPPVVPVAQVAPAPEASDVTQKLKDLAALHAAGSLSDAEFTAAKKKLIES